MYEELNISESEGVWAAYLAVCYLKEETERLQAACAAKTAELAELREQTAELFAERVAAEGADDDAVLAAMAMWKSDPQSAAQAVLGCDIAEAANPYGCNQYGHEWRGKHGEGWKPSGRGGESGKQNGGDNEKKAETHEERTKRVVVGAIKGAKSVLDELKKQIGNPPYDDINDPRVRAKINLEYELTRTQERDTEEAAERLNVVTESAKNALEKSTNKERTPIKSSALKNIYNPAKKLLQETRKAYENYKQNKSREAAKEWERKFMEFSKKKREFLNKRVELNATSEEKEAAMSFFRDAENELGNQFDEVDPNRNAR